ncbi:hypothetical protein ABIE89_008226 [Bradyrhizobium niftali]|uniref:hypothetical protein n=1 Tax=Bradyrhizobium niftali TaxID=2560055 RepID=UPI0038345F82
MDRASKRPPLTRDDLHAALSELFDIFSEWDGLIQCELDADGFPAGDSLEANVKRLISEVTDRTSRIKFNMEVRGLAAAPPTDMPKPEDIEGLEP